MNYNATRDASDHAQDCYTEYSIYVNKDRACPSIYDGLKMVQRRIIFEANQMPEKLTKSAHLAGNVMKIHPHGDSYGAIVNMAGPTCSFPLFETQGNFGSWGMFGGAASSRYTECYLSRLARFIYCQFLDYAPMIQGETGLMEPEYLPCLISYGLVEGSSGIGTGLASDIVPLNLMDIISYYEAYISNDYQFDHSKTPRPDFRYVMIDMPDEECQNAVLSHQGSFHTRSIIEQESDNIFVLRSLYGKKIEKVLSKLSYYIDNDLVDFRNESATKERFVFEILSPNVDKVKFRKDLEHATAKRSSFSRVMTMENVSVYASLDYCIKNQIEKLNIAIDLKIKTEIDKAMKRSELLRALAFFKKEHVFDRIGGRTSESLVDEMRTYKNPLWESEQIEFSDHLGYEILKRPISYLTRDHDKEIDDLEEEIKRLRSHDRKEYLLDLYKQLRDMVQPLYEERYHSILRSQVLSSPRVSLTSDHKAIRVSDDNKGFKFNDHVWLISEFGRVYRKSLSIASATEIPIDTEDKIVSVVPDTDRWIEMICSDGSGLGFDTSSYKYDKQVINLDDQKVVKVIGYRDGKQPGYMASICRTKISKPVRYK